MRRTLTAMLVLLGALGVGGWFLARHMKPQTLADLPALNPAAPSKAVTFYRWQDENGGGVVSSEPPPAGVAYTTTTVDGALTVMDSPKPVEPPVAPSGDGINPLSVYTPGGMQQAIQQAKQVSQVLEQSQENRRRQLEGQ